MLPRFTTPGFATCGSLIIQNLTFGRGIQIPSAEEGADIHGELFGRRKISAPLSSCKRLFLTTISSNIMKTNNYLHNIGTFRYYASYS
jgi:hypothetical protein